MKLLNQAIENVSVEVLTTHPRNVNRGDVGAIHESIRHNGFWGTIVAQRSSGRVLAGNHRLVAARQLGATEVPVAWVDVDDDAALRILLADNRTTRLGHDDPQALAEMLQEILGESGTLDGTAFDTDDLDQILADLGAAEKKAGNDPGPQIDRAAKLQEKWGTALGQIWEIPSATVPGKAHRLMCGDSTSEQAVAALLAGTVPDLCLTDPPYCSGGFQESGRSAGSVGTDAAHKQIANDRLSTRGYQALLKQSFSNSGAPFLYAFTDWRMWVWLFDVAESCGYGVRSMIVWDKGTPGMGRGWRAQHELVLWACKAAPPFDKYASGAGNVIGEKRTGNVNHTTEKPVALLGALLNNTPFARTVYDPFAGSGSTMVAAEIERRACFGAELDPQYVAVILERLAGMGLEPRREECA